MKRYLVLLLLFSTIQSHSSVDMPPSGEPIDPAPGYLVTWPNPLTLVDNFEVMRSYLWMQHMQLNNGLVETAENTNFISLYDNALAALAFMAQGEVGRAEQIFDFFNQRMIPEFKETGGGFYQFRDAMGNNGERVWLGDNAWLLIALNHYTSLTGNTQYDTLSSNLELWIRKMQKADGSIRSGREKGKKIPLVTEGMITAFVAVPGYDKFHEKLLRFLKKNRWDQENRLFLAWPENPHYKYALDLHSLSSLIFPKMPVNGLKDSSRFFTSQRSSVTNKNINGFCFDEDRDVVWYEGTAQMALAFKRQGYNKQAKDLLGELMNGIIDSQFKSSLGGLPYSSGPGSSYGSAKLWDHSDKRAALSSNAWLYFATVNFNPLNASAAKIIPEQDQFWLQ